ncbi:dipeptidase [Geofilum rubicundum]|uniref:Dipeptidase n=1 Tax=Geofilum rubicundum JCM 15548 TaxID=1236989 RepID=A0A0E9M293_9BACT|nr:C69 family dipeptidase [Geofilum rubicundum]GAO31639.1 probable dipeptidase [Geofilum rubicundum JCM 15548]
MKLYNLLIVIAMLWLTAIPAMACTSYLVTPGASVDGSSMITYAADSHIRYGELYYFEGGAQAPGSFYQCYDRGSHRPLAKIPNPSELYTVVGYLNEKQVAMGESTFGGRPELVDTTGMIDYGSLMFVALQRSATAREAIQVMAELVEEYGYYSSGESFSISDPNEVWIMELIGKGYTPKYDRKTKTTVNADKGAVWVAMRIPDGYISAHANQARITTFPLADGVKSITSRQFDLLNQPSVEVIYSHDVMEVARRKGYFSGTDEAFSFTDAYAPVDFGGARFCEARVWSMFRKVNSDMDQYQDYAMGYDLDNKMPLFIKPDRKLTPQDLMHFKRDHLEGTEFDMSKDAGAGEGERPYRWRPMTWKVDDKQYFHERTTATQQTAFSFIAQSRKGLPDMIAGIIWFGVDDAASSVYVPMYVGMRHAPEAYAEGFGSIIQYEADAAFWVFNKVAHLAYLQYNRIHPDIVKAQSALEARFKDFVPAVDKAALELYQKDPELAADFLTDFSVKMGNYTVERWQDLYGFLMVKHLDGNLKLEEDGVFQTNEYGRYPIVKHPDQPDWWYRLILDTTGDQFEYKE